jgi:ATP-binding cassette subfamily A (ABC1) protein 3
VQIRSPLPGEQPPFTERVENFIAFVNGTFVGCELKDRHEGLLHYHIPSDALTWSQIFGIVELAKAKYFIEDYSVSQTSLEQVFISFARPQHRAR